MGAGGPCKGEFYEKSVKKFGDLKTFRTFAFPLETNERDFSTKFIEKTEGSTSKYRDKKSIESVDFFGKRQDRLEL